MKLAEALARRKDALGGSAGYGYHEITDDAAEFLTYEEGQDKDESRANGWLDSINRRFDEAAELAEQINRTNNETRITFEGEDMSLMEAICLRDALHRKIAAYDTIVRTVTRERGGRRRSKEEVNVLPVIPSSELRSRKDAFEAQMRRLDIEIQKANWSVDLLA